LKTDVLMQHPQRVALHNEIHARPPEAMDVPLGLSHVVMVCDARQRTASWAHMAELARDHHLPPPDATDRHFNHMRPSIDPWKNPHST
jgi:hypothetical protein